MQGEWVTWRAGIPPLLPPSTHLSIHPSLPYIPPSAKESAREREREGERSSRKSFVHEHYSMTWIVVLLCEQLECLLCALMPDSHSKDPVAAARGFHSSIMRPDNSQNTLCLVQHAKLCVMGSANALLCTPICTSSMHVDAHKTVWALKLPLSIYFCEHISQHTFTIFYFSSPPQSPRPNHSPNVMCCQAGKISVHPTFFFFSFFFFKHSASSWQRESSVKVCWVVVFPRASVWSHLPLHLCTSPRHFYIFVTTDTLHALKNKNKSTATQKLTGRSTAALYSLQSDKDLRGFARPPDRKRFSSPPHDCLPLSK